MKIKELIKQLKNFDENKDVIIRFCVSSEDEIVLNYIEELEKGIKRLKNKNEDLSKEIINVKVDKIIKNYIHKDKIIEKIEELYKKKDDTDNKLSEMGFDLGQRNYLTSNDKTIEVLQEILNEGEK